MIYKIIKQAISQELAEFVYAYFLNKRAVAKHLFETRYISPFTEYWGIWNDEQIPDTYSHYADIAMETFCECGVDINHEDIIKHIEYIFGRNLYHYELIDYVQAINDYQN